MANTTELTRNALARAHHQSQLAGALAAGVSLVGGLWLGLDFIGLALAPALYGALVKPQLHAGAEGEARALGLPETEPGALVTLSDHYTLFNNLHLSFEGKTVEIDLLAVGPNGVFVVEVKHYRGHLSGRGCSQYWTQKKTSAHGNTYTNTIRNPVGQVWRQILALRRWLGRGGYRGSIEGLVVCTYPGVELDVASPKIPVVTVPELAPWIERFQPKFPQRAPHLPVLLLRQLKDGRMLQAHNRQASPLGVRQRWMRDQAIDRAASVMRNRHPAPQHVSVFLKRALARKGWQHDNRQTQDQLTPPDPPKSEESS